MKTYLIKKPLYMAVILMFFNHFVFGQTSQDSVSVFELSLEELMNVEIYTASKRRESNFEAPLSSTVITRKEIQRSGVTTIQEALRLVPGVIVREQINGQFDIHIRGFDYVPPYSAAPYTSNSITLVMIDNRVVFRDFQGGTYWESLPVEINDVERIEVVRGPSSSLYGPNAVAGVINFITRRPKEGYSLNADLQAGLHNSYLSNLSAGYKTGDFSIMVSGNYHYRNRYDDTYYDYALKRYANSPADLHNIQTIERTGDTISIFTENSSASASERYPEPDNAINKYGVNVFASFSPGDKTQFDVSCGLQNSTVQKVYVDVIHTPLTTEESKTQYIDFKAKSGSFSSQVSYLHGYTKTLGVLGWEYVFDNLDVNLEYELKLLDDKLHIRPGFLYRQVMFDDKKGVENSYLGVGLVNGRHKLNTKGFQLRTDYSPVSKLRLIAALRADLYNHPDDLYFSYQLGALYKPYEEHIFRFVASRANRGPNILDNYVSFSYKNEISHFAMYYANNQHLDLLTMDMIELGYRGLISDNMNIDIELFHGKIKDYSSSTKQDSVVLPNPNNDFFFESYLSAQNLKVKAQQYGATVVFNYVMENLLHIKPYFTIQKTMLVDVESDNVPNEFFDEEHEYTPTFYGGLSLNYFASSKLNVNLNSYFMSATKMNYLYNREFEIDAKLLTNIVLSYKLKPQITFYGNVRNINLLGIAEPESVTNVQFGFAEVIKPMVYFGIRFDL